MCFSGKPKGHILGEGPSTTRQTDRFFLEELLTIAIRGVEYHAMDSDTEDAFYAEPPRVNASELRIGFGLSISCPEMDRMIYVVHVSIFTRASHFGFPILTGRFYLWDQLACFQKRFA